MAFLSSYFRKEFRGSLHQTGWSDLLSSHLHKAPLDKSFLFEALSQFPKEAHPFYQMKSLQLLLRASLLLETKLYAVKGWLYPIATKILRHALSEEFPSIALLKRLCQKLLHKPVDPPISGDIFSAAQKNWEEYLFPHPYYSLQATLFLCFLGYIEPSVYQEKALQEVKRYEFLLDHEKLPFLSAWLKEEEFQEASIYLYYYLLFFVAGRLFKKAYYLEIAEKLRPLLQERIAELKEESLVTAILMEEWVQAKTTIPSSSFTEKPLVFSKIYEPEMGVFGNRFANMSYVFTLSGSKTSLGVIKTRNLTIAAFGPQMKSIQSTEGFGIHKRCFLVAKDFSITVNEKEARLQGWTASSDLSSWLKMAIDAKENQVDFRIESLEDSPPYFSFYIKADKCTLGEKVLFPSSLQKHKEMGNSVLLEKGGEKLTIKPVEDVPIEVISLAGKDCFWNSHFLVAFSLLSKRMHHLTIFFGRSSG